MKYIKRLALVMLLPTLISTPAFAQSGCFDAKILNTNGAKIRLSTGWSMQDYPGSNSITSLWQPLDKVVVCPLGGAAYSIMDVNQKKETIKALRQFS
jgi:hypothetical protein